ncbi:MAG TPA: hypothetical protein DIW47_05000 [Bacteroidetes bacterium]|nr:hypothetical protein [Bacteroidota bacterium]
MKFLRDHRWILLAATLFPRLLLFDFESGDYTGNLSIWYDTLKEGGFGSLKDGFHNYSPSYMYLMYLMSLTAIPKLWAIKLISVFFDYLLAWAVYRLVADQFSKKKAILAAVSALILPTVLFNSALWGQCDSVYTAFLLLSLGEMNRESYRRGMIWYALAFAFKIQAVFFILVPLALFAHKKFRFREFLWIPLVYLLSIIPNWLAGRPFGELLLIYVQQSEYNAGLSSFAPNIYQWLSWAPTELFTRFGIGFTAMLLALFFWGMFHIRVKLTPSLLVQVALFSTLLLPFFLPKMHDRYFYPADVLALIYVFFYPKKWYIPVLVVSASFFSYLYFLFATLTVFPFSVLALSMGLALLLVGRTLYFTLTEHHENTNNTLSPTP